LHCYDLAVSFERSPVSVHIPGLNKFDTLLHLGTEVGIIGIQSQCWILLNRKSLIQPHLQHLYNFRVQLNRLAEAYRILPFILYGTICLLILPQIFLRRQ
jgi:hypothetical protein